MIIESFLLPIGRLTSLWRHQTMTPLGVCGFVELCLSLFSLLFCLDPHVLFCRTPCWKWTNRFAHVISESLPEFFRNLGTARLACLAETTFSGSLGTPKYFGTGVDLFVVYTTKLEVPDHKFWASVPNFMCAVPKTLVM